MFFPLISVARQFSRGGWQPTYKQFVARKQAGKVKEKYLSPEEFDKVVESIEEDRRLIILHDDIGDIVFIRLEYPMWLEYKNKT